MQFGQNAREIESLETKYKENTIAETSMAISPKKKKKNCIKKSITSPFSVRLTWGFREIVGFI